MFAIKTIYYIFAESNQKTIYNMNLENLFKIKNVADYMRCSPTWVMKLIKAGKSKEAKELTAKYGASKIPEIKEEDYVAVYKEAEELL